MTDTRYTDAATGREWVREDAHNAAIAEARREALREAADVAGVKPRSGGKPLSGPHHQGLRDGRDEAKRLILALLDTEAPEQPKPTGRWNVPAGQTPLNDKLEHPLIDVFNEGKKARDSGRSSPYHGHSLEHCIHAMGWVQRDLRLALDEAPAPEVTGQEAAKVLLASLPNPLFDRLKCPLIGEFSQAEPFINDDGDEYTLEVTIKWTTIKEIVEAALRALAGGDDNG